MDSNLFDISNWNKKLEDKTHEDRFKDWLNGFSNPVKFDDNNITGENNLSTTFDNSFRVSKLPASIIIEEDNHFKGKDGAGSLFASLLADWDEDNIDDEDLGAKYLGTSLVFFPCYKQNSEKSGRKTIYKNELLPSGLIIALGMGSGGPGPDEKLVSNSGHIRRFEGLVKTIKNNINNNESLIWYREDPLLHKPVPESFITRTKELFEEAEPHTLKWRDDSSGGYGQYLYAIASLKFDNERKFSNNQKEIIKSFASFYARERGFSKDTKDDFAYEWYRELYSDINIEEIKEKITKNKYLILAGPPGSKKTDFINQIANTAYNSNYIKIQFHPNTTYQSFVGGIQPQLIESGANFEFFKGPLIRAIEEAKDKKFLLVIDEINRADLATVLGEAINLFEPTQKYSISISNYGNLEMPDNLHVLCAMNTADRNISSIDVAIRRRFAYINIWPNEPEGEKSCDYGRSEFNKVKSLFLEYGNNHDLNLMPGGFYFLGKNKDSVIDSIKDRLLPLLEDYLNENRISNLLLTEIELLILQYKQEI
ncbi:MAG: hypothetical protein FJZ43_04255 [Candidatus Staskawiczbacteria bacterium]|nr:hypothetical protein [Candidatus Staskawiczbacteria bacterium]